jgi:nicotinate-nucleotide pyrophosphorylase (carboxylating)
VDTLAQLRQAIDCGARLVLLDNFPLSRLRQAVRLYGRRATLEASGGIRPDQLRRVARTGVARISMGALTHSVEWADIGLDIERPHPPRARR